MLPSPVCSNANLQLKIWYIQDPEGIWHCSVCREAKLDNPYSRGHTKKAKTTNIADMLPLGILQWVVWKINFE